MLVGLISKRVVGPLTATADLSGGRSTGIDRMHPRIRQSQTQSLRPCGSNCTRRAMPRWTLVLICVWNLPHHLCPEPLPCAATLRSDHDRQIQATNEARRCHPLAGCRYQSGEHRKGSVEHDPGSSCFWRRHHPSHHDQGKSHPTP